MIKFKQAIRVGNNIEHIFNLPCVCQINKINNSKEIEVWIYLSYKRVEIERRRKYDFIANVGDWLCEDEDGKWLVLTNWEYEKHREEWLKMQRQQRIRR